MAEEIRADGLAEEISADDLAKEISADGLLMAFDRVVVSAANHEIRSVRIRALCPRDLPAMLAMVQIAKAGDERWKILNAEPIGRFKEAVHILLAMESVMVPALAVYDPAVVTALHTYTNKLEQHAAAAGGSFATQAQTLVESLDEYIANANLVLELGEPEELKARSKILLQKVTDLLDGDVTLRLG